MNIKNIIKNINISTLILVIIFVIIIEELFFGLFGLFGLFDLFISPSVTPIPTTPIPTTPIPTTPSGTTPSGTTPSATTPSGTTPSATTPSGTTPSGTTPSGTTPSGTTPSATTPSATTPSATTPSGTTPSATTPRATTPSATTPSATTPSATTPSATTVPQPPQPLVSGQVINGFFRKRINVTGEIPLPNPTDYIIGKIPYTGTLTSIVIKYTLNTDIPNTQLASDSKFSILINSFDNAGFNTFNTNLRDIDVINPLPNNKVSVVTDFYLPVNAGDFVQIMARQFAPSTSSKLKDIVVDLYYETQSTDTNYITTTQAQQRRYCTKEGKPSRCTDQ